MKWKKRGKICDHQTFGLPWFKMNIMTPVPYQVGKDVLRVFVTMCDENNRGRIGYVDLSMDDPGVILDYSRNPVLDLGNAGMFDEDGVLPSSLLVEEDQIYMFYSAYQRQVHIPYTILSGLSVSGDNGNHFKRVLQTPILERNTEEKFIRSAIDIMKLEEGYRIWYSSGDGWFQRSDKEAPRYDIKCLDSSDMMKWDGKPSPSLILLNDEYGLTMPQVWKEGRKYKMIYSIRTLSKGYRMGYGESEDGITFKRMDHKMEIEVSSDGFDQEMICFGKLFKSCDKTYLFYCGNHYGIGGMGYAELTGD